MELLEYALKKVKEAEVYEVNAKETSVLFSANKLKEIKTNFSQGVALRIINKGKIGFASTTNLKDKEKILSSAISSSFFGEKAKFKFPKINKATAVNINNPKIEKLSSEDMIEIAKECLQKIRDKRQDAYSDIQVGKEIKVTKILNSEGFDKSYHKTTFLISLFCLITKKNGLLPVYEIYASTECSPDISLLVQKILQKIKYSEKETNISSQKIPAIFSPKAILSLLEPLKLGINGKLVQKGISPLTQKIGKKIFSQSLTIYDDSTLVGGVHTSPFDDEGMPATKNIIIQKGCLKNILCDLQTSSLLGLPPTSSARRRSISSLPSPDTTNIIIDKGETSIKEMIKELKCGILVDQLIGWGANPLSGEFSGNIELGFNIEKGKITSRIKNGMISGNIYSDFNKILAISREQELTFGANLLPYILIEGASVSGKRS